MFIHPEHRIGANSTEPPDEGWQARLELGFISRGGKTLLQHRRHQGPLTVQRPFYPEGDVCHVYLLHPPGGVVAGDRLHLAVHADSGTQVLLTTPAAGKFYRSTAKVAQQQVSLQVASDAALEWLPQETIIYEGARVSSSLSLHLAARARFIGWEILSLGRPAAHEGFTQGEVTMDWHIDRQEQPLLRERLQLDARAFAARWGLNGHAACGTLFATAASTPQLECVRALIGEHPNQGVTLIDDLLICRALDERADRLRDFFQHLWRALRQDILQRQACDPRIWVM